MPGYKGGGGRGAEGVFMGLAMGVAPLPGTNDGVLLSNLGVKGGGLLMGLNPW